MKTLGVDQFLKHEAFGLGVVTASNSQYTSIDFENYGAKKVITNLLAVELLRGTPTWKRSVPSVSNKVPKNRSREK